MTFPAAPLQLRKIKVSRFHTQFFEKIVALSIPTCAYIFTKMLQRGRERKRDRETERERQTGRQTDRQTYRQTDRQTASQPGRQAGKQTDRQTNKDLWTQLWLMKLSILLIIMGTVHLLIAYPHITLKSIYKHKHHPRTSQNAQDHLPTKSEPDLWVPSSHRSTFRGSTKKWNSCKTSLVNHPFLGPGKEGYWWLKSGMVVHRGMKRLSLGIIHMSGLSQVNGKHWKNMPWHRKNLH